MSKIFLIRDGEFHIRDAEVDMTNAVRNIYGLKVPKRLSFVSSDHIRLRAKPARMIRSGFCEMDILSEMTLTLRDGKPRKTIGITQFVEPCHVNRRLVRWLSDLRIGRNGKPPLF
jgi:hypothetical protein